MATWVFAIAKARAPTPIAKYSLLYLGVREFLLDCAKVFAKQKADKQRYMRISLGKNFMQLNWRL
ncbi:MAG: hypothetical protein OHK0057_23380 [Thermoflexibacter sp.]